MARVEDPHWVVPKENIYLRESFHETEEHVFYQAEIFDFGGKTDTATVAVRTVKGRFLEKCVPFGRGLKSRSSQIFSGSDSRVYLL